MFIRQNILFFYKPNSKPEDVDNCSVEIKDNAQPCFFRSRKKPQWVIDKVIYLKAVNPSLGCRKIAELFDRIHAAKHNMTVSKSYVYCVLRNHRYEIQILRRMIKHRRPKNLKKNICWGLDLTTITDETGKALTIFAIVDYGSRRCVCLQQVSNKSSLTLLFICSEPLPPVANPKPSKPIMSPYLFPCYSAPHSR